MKRSLTFPFIFRSAQKYPTVCFQAFAGRVQQSTILTRRHVIGCKLTTSWMSSQADLQPNFWDFCPFLREREREMDGGQTTSERGKSSGQRSLATPSSLFLFSFLLHISLLLLDSSLLISPSLSCAAAAASGKKQWEFSEQQMCCTDGWRDERTRLWVGNARTVQTGS